MTRIETFTLRSGGLLAIALVAAACADASGQSGANLNTSATGAISASDGGAASTGSDASEPGCPMGGKHHKMPKLCESDADCTECPAGEGACACKETPFGKKLCLVTCAADADCPKVEGAPPLSCHEGVCVPPKHDGKGPHRGKGRGMGRGMGEGPGMGGCPMGGKGHKHPKVCETTADCTECPAGEGGCACTDTPMGKKLCLVTCATDADCGKVQGGPPLSCHEGVCVPPKMKGDMMPPPEPGA